MKLNLVTVLANVPYYTNAAGDHASPPKVARVEF